MPSPKNWNRKNEYENSNRPFVWENNNGEVLVLKKIDRGEYVPYWKPSIEAFNGRRVEVSGKRNRARSYAVAWMKDNPHGKSTSQAIDAEIYIYNNNKEVQLNEVKQKFGSRTISELLKKDSYSTTTHGGQKHILQLSEASQRLERKGLV